MTQNEHVYAICCRPEVAGDVISSENVKTVEGYVMLNFETATISSFRENLNQPFVYRVDDVCPVEPHFRGQGAKCLIGCRRRNASLESLFPKL